MSETDQLVDEWLGRPYVHVIEPALDDAAGGYWAYVPQFGKKAMRAWGETRAEAEEALTGALELAFRSMARQGEDPGPAVASLGLPENLPSGKFVVRMSPELHAKLQHRSEQLGVSMNQYVVERLAEAIGGEGSVLAPAAIQALTEALRDALAPPPTPDASPQDIAAG